ncbi:hypothetical protein sscle_07g061680 [Sclerotinia sclerotiorum 1980 UF-70]|uniref:BZIP domain-containing protein n=1 Tax=Sclerotinia sclerotiorum (strain ATCC 18683 / 1980 / Ss-1) TaxID=665079 RepID=A0A1D9Q8X7_SCLS1|nr:hypothetical protein sscle_07g061680 [Sclerotinia sclerotiorum 1980 UF-70]
MSTPNLKFEQSPAESLAESFTSTPGQQYTSLFHPHQSMEPMQALTPQSFDDDSMFGDDMTGEMGGSLAGTPAPEKKPVKKRKSWGQQLPEPKTNLPPRKRAKTEDEKEQRRVERVLRNRRAAQTSRERKRQEVEALEAQKQQIERRNRDLELQLANMASKYEAVRRKLEQFTGMTGENITSTFTTPSVNSTPNRSETFHAKSPIALTKGLFESEDSSIQPMMTPIRDTHNTMQSAMGTVDLASVSPPPMESTDDGSFRASSFVSTESTTALDEFSSEYSNYTSFGQYPLDPNDGFDGHLEYPDSLGADQTFFNERVGPIADAFSNNFDNLAGDNIGAANDALFEDFIHQDEITQSAPEVHSSDSFIEKTFSLQSQHGASSSGCDVGGNAVIV